MASPTPGAGRLCAAGSHLMDPNWETCPYCEAERRAKERAPTTRASSQARGTRVGGVIGGGKRETKTMPSGPPAGSGGQAGEIDTRRIMGVLVTYTWQPQGQLFPICEGKNYIGAGYVSSEPTPRKCEILIDADTRMSSEHALILCRANRYDLVDQKSSNGTFLGNELVPVQGMELPNYAVLKTGSTVWTFIKITPRAGEVVTPGPVVTPPEAVVEVTEGEEPPKTKIPTRLDFD